MKKLFLVLILTLATSALYADTTGLDNFVNGNLTNVTFFSGPVFNLQTHDVGVLGGLAYNTPKLSDVPFQPYFVPTLAVMEQAHSFYSFNGGVSVNKDIEPFAAMLGTNTWAGKIKFTIHGSAGVVQNISGEQFGGFKVPGKAPSDGQGTGAETGIGGTVTFAKIGIVKLGLDGEYFTVTTIAGPEVSALLTLSVAPKGW